MMVAIQRFRDLFFLVLSLPIWGSLLTFAVLKTYLSDKKPIFYTQTRIGLNGKPFEIYKIRTMLVQTHLADDLRITKNGHFLRDWSLDELPQIWNIIKGEMSLIGPRPLLWHYRTTLTSDVLEKRHRVLPGLSGWAQVNGRNELSWEEKLELDCYYVDHQSIGLDFKILFKTLPIWFLKKGIYTKDGKMMPTLDIK